MKVTFELKSYEPGSAARVWVEQQIVDYYGYLPKPDREGKISVDGWPDPPPPLSEEEADRLHRALVSLDIRRQKGE